MGDVLYVSLLGAAKRMENGFDKLFSGFATNSIFLWAQKTSIPYEGFPKEEKFIEPIRYGG
jgi:putative ABC transport system permease protein